MKHRGEKWTDEEIELAKKLYASGLKIDDIVLQVNHSNSAVLHKLKQVYGTSRRIDWTEEDLSKLKELFNKGFSYAEIAKELGKTVRACQGKAVRIGLKKKECNVWSNNKREDFWTNDEVEKLKILIETGASRKEIANKLFRTEKSINCKMNELRYFLKERSLLQESNNRRVYTVDDDYFENVDTQKKAYWLGWMVTDGYVISELHTKRGVVRCTKVGLKIHEKDLCVVEEFTKDTKSTFPIKHNKAGTNNNLFTNKFIKKTRVIISGPQCNYEVSSAKMVQDLSKYGVVQNKTYTIGYPELLKEEFSPGFIAGVISGDGSVNLKKNHNETYLLRCNIAGNLVLLEPIKNILVKYIGYNPDKKIFKYKSAKNLYSLELNQTETIKMYYWMKENNIFLMKRKNDIIEDFIKEHDK